MFWFGTNNVLSFVLELCQVRILAATWALSFVVLFQCLQPCVEIVRSLKLAESSEYSTWCCLSSDSVVKQFANSLNKWALRQSTVSQRRQFRLWSSVLWHHFFTFNVRGSVHRNNILMYIQQDAHVTEFILSDNCSTCLGRHYHPSSGAQNNCNYSIW